MKPTFRKYKRGEVILAEHQPGRSMFIIRKGRVRIARLVDGKAVCLDDLDREDFFGEMSLLTGEGRSASAVALEDCELLEINEEAFQEALGQAPAWIGGMFKGLARRLRRLNDRIGKDLMYQPPGKRS